MNKLYTLKDILRSALLNYNKFGGFSNKILMLDLSGCTIEDDRNFICWSLMRSADIASALGFESAAVICNEVSREIVSPLMPAVTALFQHFSIRSSRSPE